MAVGFRPMLSPSRTNPKSARRSGRRGHAGGGVVEKAPEPYTTDLRKDAWDDVQVILRG